MLTEVLVVAALALALAFAIPRGRTSRLWLAALLGVGHACLAVVAAVGIYVGVVAAGAVLQGPPPPAPPPAIRGCGPMRSA